eukprot:5572963-Pleurochrysis_carterae.AAC.3
MSRPVSSDLACDFAVQAEGLYLVRDAEGAFRPDAWEAAVEKLPQPRQHKEEEPGGRAAETAEARVALVFCRTFLVFWRLSCVLSTFSCVLSTFSCVLATFSCVCRLFLAVWRHSLAVWRLFLVFAPPFCGRVWRRRTDEALS